MKMKKTAMLLTALALGAFAAHAGAATINSGDYQSVKSAFEALGDGDTLVLTEDCSLDDTVEISNKATLDLNGHVLTSQSAAILVYGDLIVKDGTETTGKFVLTEGTEVGILVASGSFTLESGKIDGLSSDGAIAGMSGDGSSNVIININGGMIEVGDNGVAVCNYSLCEFNMTGGTIKGGVAIGVGIEEGLLNTIKISGGIVDGALIFGYREDDVNIGNKIEISGGTFTSDDFKEYIDSSLVRPLDNGSYAVGENVTATVATENVSQQTIGDTTATGFVTTISSDEAFDLKTIKWDVIYNNETKSTSEYKLDGVTLNGDAKIGLAVGGFADANATAAATINGYIK